jgi:hypothetical protein
MEVDGRGPMAAIPLPRLTRIVESDRAGEPSLRSYHAAGRWPESFRAGSVQPVHGRPSAASTASGPDNMPRSALLTCP